MFQQKQFGIKCYFKIIEAAIYLMLKSNEFSEKARQILDLFNDKEQKYADIYN